MSKKRKFDAGVKQIFKNELFLWVSNIPKIGIVDIGAIQMKLLCQKWHTLHKKSKKYIFFYWMMKRIRQNR